MKPERELVPAILELAADEKKQEELIANISQLAVTDADEMVARAIIGHSKETKVNNKYRSFIKQEKTYQAVSRLQRR
jgi:hypothetical protein